MVVMMVALLCIAATSDWLPLPNLGEILHPIWFLFVYCFVFGAHTQWCSGLPPSQHFGIAPGSRSGDGDETRDICMQRLCSTFWFNSRMLCGSALQSRPCLDHLILIPFLSPCLPDKSPTTILHSMNISQVTILWSCDFGSLSNIFV